jgi:YVTN family beta-propeller protein
VIRLFSMFLLCSLAVAGTRPSDLPLKFLSPGELAVSPDGRRLYVVCEKSDELRVVDTATGRVLKVLTVGHVPRGLSVSANGKQVFVANSWNDTVSVVDSQTLEAVTTVKTGFEPISAVADKKGETLYVANRLSSDISVIDLQTGKEL